jgi:hypothetical protein
VQVFRYDVPEVIYKRNLRWSYALGICSHRRRRHDSISVVGSLAIDPDDS